ncbi:MAG: hypothetical protein ABIO72_03625 [Patescibacteria group bacterium]
MNAIPRSFPNYNAVNFFAAQERAKDLKNLLVLATPIGLALGFLVNLTAFLH